MVTRGAARRAQVRGRTNEEGDEGDVVCWGNNSYGQVASSEAVLGLLGAQEILLGGPLLRGEPVYGRIKKVLFQEDFEGAQDEGAQEILSRESLKRAS